jgi:hypothetical protein
MKAKLRAANVVMADSAQATILMPHATRVKQAVFVRKAMTKSVHQVATV